ncbi:hypothetical protein Zmor_014314 [Zophobas morio]|uniref:Uncharacterized protein n=1 Tax=Zophobas morio TaxID=2755281 RepID=A0AA38MG25_9CUCU|nr:hypothetical protein Zmor_014314 [Zophobas morio]
MEQSSFLSQRKNIFPTINKNTQRQLVQHLSKEVARLEAFRDHNLHKLIEESKITLTNLWEQCHYGSSIRNGFPEIYTNDYNQAVLDHFNEEMKKWEEFYDQHW